MELHNFCPSLYVLRYICHAIEALLIVTNKAKVYCRKADRGRFKVRRIKSHQLGRPVR